MTTTDLAVREEKALDLIDSGAFVDRVKPLLPDTVPVGRFLTVAKTAIRTNPDLVQADQRTLMGALIRCAQDGLLPDGREAALTVYSGKVQYLPMIDGLRKTLAEYGWTLKTRCVYSNDDFEYVEEPPVLRHVPVRPGEDRGIRIAAYAVARHTDGRRLQIVLDEPAIAKRRAKAQTKKVWDEHPDPMAEKSAGHAIFDEIPRAERDRMIVPADNGVDNAVELLYGPDGHEFPVRPTPTGDAAAALPLAGGSAQKGGSERQQAEPVAVSSQTAAGSVPGDDPDDDPEPQPPAGEPVADAGEPVADAVNLAELALTVVPAGNAYAGKTLGDVAATDDGREWISWGLRNQGRLGGDGFADTLATFAALVTAQGAV